MENSNVVSAHLDANVALILRKIATEEDRSVSWLVGLAVKQFIASRQPNAGFPKMAQVDLEDAIAASKKSTPSKSAKHK
jgi:hypothetical protein